MGIGADGERLATPEELHALLLGVFVFEVECGDVALAAAIEQVDGLRAQAARGVGGIDGGVTGADHDHRPRDFADAAGLVSGNQFERIHHAVGVFAGDVQLLHGAEADAEKDEVEFGFERCKSLQPIQCLRRNETQRPCGESFRLRAGFLRRAACTRPLRRY